jgi:FtsZ-binding cell division protein ZapB
MRALKSIWIFAHLYAELIPTPALPPPDTEQEAFFDYPYRMPLPLVPGLPYVVDPSSLQMAVGHDPQHMFNAIHLLVKERDDLRAANNNLRTENSNLREERNILTVENKTLTENFESARLDYRVARDKLDKMEKITQIQSAKQVILWKFIERLQTGQQGPSMGADGYWKDENGSPMTAVSEASEPSSDRSAPSTAGSKDSSETKLDPNAVSSLASSNEQILTSGQQPFTPQLGSSPESLHPKTYIDHDFPEALVTLPAKYFGVCPNSLSSPGPCPVPHCRLQPVCEDFNDEHGFGCSNRFCKFAHLYRTCTEALDGVECSYFMSKEKNAKKRVDAHMKKRIHPYGAYPTGGSGVNKKEWQLRVDIASLREAHKEHKY